MKLKVWSTYIGKLQSNTYLSLNILFQQVLNGIEKNVCCSKSLNGKRVIISKLYEHFVANDLITNMKTLLANTTHCACFSSQQFQFAFPIACRLEMDTYSSIQSGRADMLLLGVLLFSHVRSKLSVGDSFDFRY